MSVNVSELKKYAHHLEQIFWETSTELECGVCFEVVHRISSDRKRKHCFQAGRNEARFYIGSGCVCNAVVCVTCGRETRKAGGISGLKCPLCRALNNYAFPAPAFIPKGELREAYITARWEILTKTPCKFAIPPQKGQVCRRGRLCLHSHEADDGTIVQQHDPLPKPDGSSTEPDWDGPTPANWPPAQRVQVLVPSRPPQIEVPPSTSTSQVGQGEEGLPRPLSVEEGSQPAGARPPMPGLLPIQFGPRPPTALMAFPHVQRRTPEVQVPDESETFLRWVRSQPAYRQPPPYPVVLEWVRYYDHPSNRRPAPSPKKPWRSPWCMGHNGIAWEIQSHGIKITSDFLPLFSWCFKPMGKISPWCWVSMG